MQISKYYKSPLILASIFVLLFLILVNIMFWVIKAQIGYTIDSHLNDNLLRIGKLVAADIEKNYIRQGLVPDSTYLDSVKATLDFDEIFLADVNGNSLADSRSIFQQGAEYALTITDSYRWNAAINGKPNVSPVIQFQGERFKNVFIPVGNPVVAVLVLEISPAYLYIWDRLTQFLIWLGVLSALIALFLLWFLRRMINLLLASEQKVRDGERLALIGQFAAGLAHEIRNPLSIITSSIDVMQKNKHSDSTLDDILEEILKLDNIVTEFLYLASPKHPKIILINFDQWLQSSISRWQRLLDNRTVEIKKTNNEPITLNTDPDLLTRIFDNLISNSIKYSSTNAKIRISINSSAKQFNCYYEDSGPLNERLNINRIFEPFYTTNKQSTGLGLAIVKSAVIALNGTITISLSELGGLKFKIVFPREANKGSSGSDSDLSHA
jgi:signal transduction histidine kinase